MFEFIPNTIPDTVVVIGCGGTGSRLVPMLCQFLKTLSWIPKPTVILVDDDIVEEKNLIRQNFVSIDVGRPKAVVLAERYGAFFNINVIPRVERIETPSYLRIFDDGGSSKNPLIIMCVDTAEARRDILKAFSSINSYQNPFYIDAGNEDSYGQVTFFQPKVVTMYPDDRDIFEALPKQIPVRYKTKILPMDYKFYVDLKDLPSTRSCADLDQTLAINALMAATIMGVVQSYYYVKPISFNRINVSLTNGGSTQMLTVNNFTSMARDCVIEDHKYRLFRNEIKVKYCEMEEFSKGLQREYLTLMDKKELEKKLKQFEGLPNSVENQKMILQIASEHYIENVRSLGMI